MSAGGCLATGRAASSEGGRWHLPLEHVDWGTATPIGGMWWEAVTAPSPWPMLRWRSLSGGARARSSSSPSH